MEDSAPQDRKQLLEVAERGGSCDAEQRVARVSLGSSRYCVWLGQGKG